MNTPKACQLCGFCDTLGVCATCPNDGEASWSPLVATFVPEPEPPAASPEPEPTKAPSKGRGGRK